MAKKKDPGPIPMPRSKREARIIVAKDVLEKIRLKKIKATPGTYIYLHGLPTTPYDATDDGPFEGKDARADIRAAKSCEVCGVGAAFVSAVDKFDKCNWKYFNNEHGDGVHHYEILKKIFSPRQLMLIESAFERASFASEDKEEKICQAAVNFGCRFKDATNRLRAIMKNIVKNGEFRP